MSAAENIVPFLEPFESSFSEAYRLLDAQLAWFEELSVGDPTMDDQHKTLLSMLHNFPSSDGLSPSELRDRLLGTLDDVLTYCEGHLAEEEALMESVGYPYRDQHIAEHNTFRFEAAQIFEHLVLLPDAAAYDAILKIAHELRWFIAVWFISHIGRSDQRYADYVRTHPPLPPQATHKPYHYQTIELSHHELFGEWAHHHPAAKPTGLAGGG